jgi:hypothetical protein
MKKITILIISFMAISFIAFSQNCTYCNGNTIAWENYSSALGIENTSTGEASFASGKYNSSTNVFSTALGYQNTASGSISVSIGNNVLSSGTYSIGLGSYLEPSGTRSMVIGSGAAFGSNLINSNPNSLMIGFGSSKPTLFVSTASDNDKTGTIGIGDVTNPTAKLHIKTDYGEQSVMLIEPWTWNSNQWSEIRIGTENHAVRASANYGLEFKTENDYIFNSTDANVGIGTSSPDATLDVDGDIICGAIEVMDLGEWKDYVFNEDYNLRSLQEIENFINENHHLPDIPSEVEVLENGYNMGEMDAMLLQKIEELTLYIIEQSKEINNLKAKLNQ